ncbi:hypothetical protein [Hymenobacter coccineus]|uniref:Uncharacterized protein n=1 Tax=Hymenobacter coccineus TaxID=1908235 RepID=A0A1G1SR67_9BACT|nr:hypothetical protein [Hymenobacter coccineus]OGX81123.1 hypothetical protein BEN49_15955 [Hymenobacter coccineus]
MQNQFFEAVSGAQARASRFSANDYATPEARIEPDDFRPQLHLTLHGPDSLSSGILIRFEGEAEATVGPLRLAARSGAVAYALPLAQLTDSTTVALSVAGLAPGRYALWADALYNFSATAIWLVDAHAGVRVNLRQEPGYVFTAVAAAPGRFWLHFLPLDLGEYSTAPDLMRALATPSWAQA